MPTHLRTIHFRRVNRKLYTCIACGCLVQKSEKAPHAIWHTINGAWGDVSDNPRGPFHPKVTRVDVLESTDYPGRFSTTESKG